MKRLRLRKIIKKIQDDPKCWNQQTWHSECGTSHCIAGHCQIAAGKYDNNIYNNWDHIDREQVKIDAIEYLGIDKYQTGFLFQGYLTLKEIIKFEKTNGGLPTWWDK